MTRISAGKDGNKPSCLRFTANSREGDTPLIWRIDAIAIATERLRTGQLNMVMQDEGGTGFEIILDAWEGFRCHYKRE